MRGIGPSCVKPTPECVGIYAVGGDGSERTRRDSKVGCVDVAETDEPLPSEGERRQTRCGSGEDAKGARLWRRGNESPNGNGRNRRPTPVPVRRPAEGTPSRRGRRLTWQQT